MSIEKLSTSASLKQVMDKFEEISFTDFYVIDIKRVTEVPSKVKNGQIILLCNNESLSGKIYVTGTDESNFTFNENDIYIKYNSWSDYEFKIKNNQCVVDFKIWDAKIFKNGQLKNIDMYLGYNDKWLKLGDFFLFDGTNGQSYQDKYNVNGDASISFQNNKIHLQSNQGTHINGVRQGSTVTKNAIDLSKFNTLFIELAYNQYSSGSLRYGMFELIDTQGKSIFSKQYTNYTSRYIAEVDVSQINVECNVKFTIYNRYTGDNTSNYNTFEIFNAYLR